MYVILIYDISTEENGAKVLGNVFKICKRYLTHVQKSVFEGEVSESRLFALKADLRKHVRDGLDSVILFKGRNDKWLEREFWTDVEDRRTNVF